MTLRINSSEVPRSRTEYALHDAAEYLHPRSHVRMSVSVVVSVVIVGIVVLVGIISVGDTPLQMYSVTYPRKVVLKEAVVGDGVGAFCW